MPRTQYRNTDLDVISDVDLTSLVVAMEALGADSLGMHRRDDGDWCAIFESGSDGDPETSVVALLDIVAALDGVALDLWMNATRREFNVGYDCGEEPAAFGQSLRVGTVLRIADARASLRWTLYAPEHAGSRRASSRS